MKVILNLKIIFYHRIEKYENINNIYDYKNIEPYKKGNTIDLNKIELAFLNMCKDLNLISEK